jgi:hypothetical protein
MNLNADKAHGGIDFSGRYYTQQVSIVNKKDFLSGLCGFPVSHVIRAGLRPIGANLRKKDRKKGGKKQKASQLMVQSKKV